MKDQQVVLSVKKVDKISATQVRLTLEFGGDFVLREEHRTANRYCQAAKIPGFRPGKAPLKLIRNKYREEIQKDLISGLVEKGLVKAFDETKLVPVSRPQISFSQVPNSEGKPFEFQAEFQVRPEIELRHYLGVPLKAVEITASDEEVNKAIENIRQHLAVMEPCDQQKAEKGFFGMVEIGFEILGDQGKKEEPKPAMVELGAGKLLPELEGVLLEMSVGESRRVNAKFPDDFGQKEYAGKEALFDCKLVEMKKKVLPEVDDSLASQLKEGSTLETLKTEIMENILASKREENRKNQRKEIIDYLVANHEFEVPSVLVEQQSASLIQWILNDMKQKGIEEPPPLKDEVVKEVKARAEHMVRSSLILREIANKEKIVVDEDKVRERIGEAAAQLKQGVEETEKLLQQKGLLDSIRDEVLTDQVFEFISEKSEIVNVSPRS